LKAKGQIRPSKPKISITKKKPARKPIKPVIQGFPRLPSRTRKKPKYLEDIDKALLQRYKFRKFDIPDLDKLIGGRL